MTNKEFSNQFDIQYNSIATNSAPSLDLYEKSVYLTRAQLELVKNYFSPDSNTKRKGFEGSSKRRYDLENLVSNYNAFDKIKTDFIGISTDSQFFKIPNNVFLILQEQCISLDPRLCQNYDIYFKSDNTKSSILDPKDTDNVLTNQIKDRPILKVVPKTHDEYNIQIDNPFKNPNEKTVWRINYDYTNDIINGNNKKSLKRLELISNYDIYLYKFRYLKYPEPIILTNLRDLYPEENLTINSNFEENSCKLNQGLHQEILDRAVELALVDYKPEQSLQLKTQMNLRNE